MKVKARQRIQNFNKRWNIVLNDKAEFIKFRNRIALLLDHHLGDALLDTPEITERFVFLFGGEQQPKSRSFAWNAGIPEDKHLADNEVYKTIATAADKSQLMLALQCLLWALEDCGTRGVGKFIDNLPTAVAISPTIDVAIARQGNRVTLYPGGARLLDEAVVNEALEWLDQYPQVSKHFEEALRIYQTKDVKKYRNLLDNLRFAGEQLLRALLKNRKSLENQKAPLSDWLEAHGVHKQVQNMYASMLFGPYAMYQNEAVKHGDKSSPVEVEYMIYLTGTFIRFLLQVNQETAHGA